MLIGAAFVPGRVSGSPAGRCIHPRCQRQVAHVEWTRPLPGSWTAQSGALGTVLSQGQAYAGVGSGVAAVGFGMTVAAYRLSTGRPLWTGGLTGFPVGSSVVSVRSWSGVVTAGVSVPSTGTGTSLRYEVVLSATTGSQLRTYPSAAYGGAVQADAARTVVVGTRDVTSYANATGEVIWRRPIGSVAQAWRVDGDHLLITESKGGYLGASPVTALRRIEMRTGAQAVLRPSGKPFQGALSYAIGSVVLFSSPAGLSAYSVSDGQLLWQAPDAQPEVVDAIRQVVYVVSGGALTGLDPVTGKAITHAATPGAVGLYAVSDGVAVGLDEGALGDAWGYDLARKRVIWTTRAMPWPHFFVDLSGVGGSADRSGRTMVLASCAQLGVATAGASGPPCLRPELVAIGLGSRRKSGPDGLPAGQHGIQQRRAPASRLGHQLAARELLRRRHRRRRRAPRRAAEPGHQDDRHRRHHQRDREQHGQRAPPQPSARPAAAGGHPEPDPEGQDRQPVPEFFYPGHFLVTSKPLENGELCRQPRVRPRQRALDPVQHSALACR